MGRADYLDANLYHCDAPLLSRSNGSHLQIAVLDWTDYTLSNLTTVRYNDTSTLARSFEDGRVYWLSGGDLRALSFAVCGVHADREGVPGGGVSVVMAGVGKAPNEEVAQ